MGKTSWPHQPLAACWGPREDKGYYGETSMLVLATYP